MFEAICSNDGYSGSFQGAGSFVHVHSIEPVLLAPKQLFMLSYSGSQFFRSRSLNRTSCFGSQTALYALKFFFFK